MSAVAEEPEILEAEASLAESVPAFDNETLPQARLFNPWIVALVVTIRLRNTNRESLIAED